MDSIKNAQQDMRNAYYDGGPGMLVSGLVWLLAACVGWQVSVKASVLTLFFGGMLIFPMGMMVAKLLHRSGKHSQGNPLSSLALESTVLLFIGLFIAFVAVQSHPQWFFPIMLLIIGGRYVLFQTLYGLKVYWVIGVALMAAGVLCWLLALPFYMGAFAGAVIEIMVALWVMYKAQE